MNDKEKLDLIAEAVRDVQRGVLPERSFFYAVAGIVIPPEPLTEEMLAWGKEFESRADDKMCKKCGLHPSSQPHSRSYNSEIHHDDKIACIQGISGWNCADDI